LNSLELNQIVDVRKWTVNTRGCHSGISHK
jgi:hypothetical protein